MEEKKETKISLSTVFLIIAIFIIIIMALYIYTDKTKSDEEIAKSEINTINMENTTSNLQEQEVFTEEKVKTALSNCLELKAHANCDALLECLTEKGKLNYDSSKDTILEDATIITTIKFSDYKKAMLNYVSENEFEKNWTSDIYINENEDGYLTTTQGGGGLRIYNIKSITKKDDTNYTAETSYNIDSTDNEENAGIEEFIFSVKFDNGNCVIDSIESMND